MYLALLSRISAPTLERDLSKLLGFPVQVAGAGPDWRGRLLLHDGQVGSLLTVRTAVLGLDARALLGGRVRVGSLQLLSPTLHLNQELAQLHFGGPRHGHLPITWQDGTLEFAGHRSGPLEGSWDGQKLTVTQPGGGRLEMADGNLAITRLSVGKDESINGTVTTRPLAGSLDLQTRWYRGRVQVDGLRVRLDGTALGSLPLQADLPFVYAQGELSLQQGSLDRIQISGGLYPRLDVQLQAGALRARARSSGPRLELALAGTSPIAQGRLRWDGPEPVAELDFLRLGGLDIRGAAHAEGGLWSGSLSSGPGEVAGQALTDVKVNLQRGDLTGAVDFPGHRSLALTGRLAPDAMRVAVKGQVPDLRYKGVALGPGQLDVQVSPALSGTLTLDHPVPAARLGLSMLGLLAKVQVAGVRLGGSLMRPEFSPMLQ